MRQLFKRIRTALQTVESLPGVLDSIGKTVHHIGQAQSSMEVRMEFLKEDLKDAHNRINALEESRHRPVKIATLG